MAYNNKKFLDQGGTSYLWQMIEAELAKKQNTGDYATNTRVATAEGRITTLEGKHAVGKTVAQEIDDAIEALDLSELSTAISTLVDNDSGKSARTIASEELAAQLIPANADAALDTLQEIAAWIQDHPDDAAAMASSISALQSKLVLGTRKVDGVDTEYSTVRDYVERYVAAQLANYTTTAPNQAALDLITETLIQNWNSAYSASHSHSNSAVLDAITAQDVSNWNSAENNAKVYADGLASNYDAAGEAAAVYAAIKSISNNEIDAAIAAGKAAANSNSETTT